MIPRVVFDENEIKFRKTMSRELKSNERRDGRLNVGCDTLKNYVDKEDSIELIIIKGGNKKV